MSKQLPSFVYSYRGSIHGIPWREIRVALSKQLERGAVFTLTITCNTVEKTSLLQQTDAARPMAEKQSAVVAQDISVKPKKRPTMIDVAREANVSISTVSRVLSNKWPVSSMLYERVEAVVKRLDYTPNEAARAMVQSKCRKTEGRLGSEDVFAIVDTGSAVPEAMNGNASNLSNHS